METTFNKRKTFLFIHPGASVGGGVYSLFETLKRIKQRYRIIVVLPEEGPFSELLEKEEIEYKTIPLSIFYYCSQAKTFSTKNIFIFVMSCKNLFTLLINSFGNIFYLARILKKEDPDTVIINSSSLLLCGVIAKIMKKPVVCHIREVISTEKFWILKKTIAGILNFSAEKIIVNSEFSLRDMLNLKIRNLYLVHNGVDLEKFYKRSISKEEISGFGLGPDDKIVGFVGQIYQEKGWRTLVKAAFLLTQRLPNVKFLIVGSSHMMDRENFSWPDPMRKHREDVLFQKILEEMKIRDKFILLGQRFDVENILSLMNCLVFPSTASESFGRVMIEAMAAGLPVVASDIGAASEIILDNETGLLFAPDNPEILAEALIDILTHEEKAKNMGFAGRQRTEEYFGIEKIVPQLLKIYSNE